MVLSRLRRTHSVLSISAGPGSLSARPADQAGPRAAIQNQIASDPLLDSLVARAIAGNLDLAVVESRLRQAREALVQARPLGCRRSEPRAAWVRASTPGTGPPRTAVLVRVAPRPASRHSQP